MHADEVMNDYTKMDLDPTLRALGQYAVKLTRTPGEMGPSDVAALREVGLSDAQILAANLVASYFNFINRVADGLGVDLEEWMQTKNFTL